MMGPPWSNPAESRTGQGSIEGFVIMGGGGHARDVISVATAAGRAHQILGIVAPEIGDRAAIDRLGIPWLGDDVLLRDLPTNTGYVAAAGSPTVRRRMDRMATSAGLKPISLIHPSAAIGSDVVIDEGVVVFPGVVITTNVRIARHTHVNVCASISHDCHLESYVTVNPGARLCGWVSVGSGTMIGAGATIIERIRVAGNSRVGAGAAVVKDVLVGQTVVGVPARPLRDSPNPSS